MKHLLRLSAVAGMFALFAFAENYSGRLLDATCIEQGKSKVCDPTSTSTNFALNVDGKIYRLDDAGNAKAVEALKNRADRQKDPGLPVNTVTAKVAGTKEGEVLRVDAIEVQ
jgi:hypothetical protein